MIQSTPLEETYRDILDYDLEILDDVQAHKIPYYQNLVAIRQELDRSLEDFPHFKCKISSCLVESLLSITMVQAFYRPHHSKEPVRYYKGEYFGFQRMHYCNFDIERSLYVDLSQDQYKTRLPGIVIMPSTTEILVMDRFIDTQNILSKDEERIIDEIKKSLTTSSPPLPP